MRGLILSLCAALALAACVEDPPPGGPEGKPLSDAERAECLARGGTAGRGGLLPDEVCFLPQPDAGKSCSAAGDCAGQCLADTRTCSTVTPMFGCYDFLDETGKTVGICVD